MTVAWPRSTWGKILAIFVAVIVLFLVLVFVSKKVIERAERKHLEHEDPGEAPVADVKD